MDIKPGLKNYITALKTIQPNKTGKEYYEFIIKNAVEKKKEPFTDDERKEIRHIFYERFPGSQCYRNAQTLSICNPELDYVEGWVESGLPIPIEHAWNEYHGKILDVTLIPRTENELKKILPSGLRKNAKELAKQDAEATRFDDAIYYGVKISKRYINNIVLDRMIHSNFLGEFFLTCIKPLKDGQKPPKNCGDLTHYKL